MQFKPMCAAAAVCAALRVFAISPADYPDADTVVIDDSTKIEYFPDGSYVEENDERILALTEKGRKSLRSANIYFSRRYGEGEFVKVEIIGTNGVARAVDFRDSLKEATDNSDVASNIYDPNDRKLSCAVPGMEVGETRRIVTRKKAFRARMKNAFAYGALFEYTSPIMRASLEIVSPPELPIAKVKIRHPAGDTLKRLPDERLPDGKVRMRWVAENVPQAFPEPDMPEFGSVVQELLVSTVPSWETASKWYWDLCEPRISATDAAMKDKVRELVKNCGSRESRIRAIFKFVSQEIRYMGLMMEDDSPGYTPHDVRITFGKRYGVCRDKAALLVAMLRMAGIEAYPVLISVGPRKDEDVPMPYFNHAIAAVAQPSGEFLLLDSTNENTKDLLPAYLMDCSYLVAHPKGRTLAVVPVKPASENAFVAETEGFLSPDGSAVLRTSATFLGVNDLLRGAFVKMTPAERRRVFESLIRGGYPGAELLSFEMSPRDLRDTDAPLAVSFETRVPDLVTRGATRDELLPPFFFSGFAVADRLVAGSTYLDSRRFPLKFFSTAKAEERLTLKTGGALGQALSMPPEVRLGTNGYGYVRSMEMDGDVFKALGSRTVGTVELPPEEYLSLKADLKEMERLSRRMPQFAPVPPARESNTRTISSSTQVRLSSPHSWTVTNTWKKEILTYSGKKSSSELKFSFNPAVGSVEVVSAAVCNPDGSTNIVSSVEVNTLDAGWAASAPRYAASKKLVVNLPSVETGSVIRVTSVSCVTNSPVAYCNMFVFDSFDSIQSRSVEVCGSVPLKVVDGRDPGNVLETNAFSRAVTDPPALSRERSLPPSLLWRDCAMVSAADLKSFEKDLFGALRRARRKGSRASRWMARSLAKNEQTPEGRIKAVRDWLWKNVRIAGPGLFELPFDIAFFPPDRSLRDGYASSADWLNLYFSMLEAVGFDVEYVLTDGDTAGYPAILKARRDAPQPDDFDNLLIRAVWREGNWMLGVAGGTEREFILGCENEYAQIGVRDIEGRSGRTEYRMSIDVEESGSARIAVSNLTWGTAVAGLRKKYSEMLPEMRFRHFAELVGNIAESAEAISQLETDVEGYPFSMSYSVHVPGYAAKNGDTLTLDVPGIGGAFLPEGESVRRNPFGVPGRLAPSVVTREIFFPEGYAAVEHLPEPWEIKLPGEESPRWRLDVQSRIENGRLVVTFREESFPSVSGMFPADWRGLFRELNRRTGSRLSSTVLVRKAEPQDGK